jgi:hypothetical protein
VGKKMMLFNFLYYITNFENSRFSPDGDATILKIKISGWVGDCCLTPIQQFFNYIMARTS